MKTALGVPKNAKQQPCPCGKHVHYQNCDLFLKMPLDLKLRELRIHNICKQCLNKHETPKCLVKINKKCNCDSSDPQNRHHFLLCPQSHQGPSLKPGEEVIKPNFRANMAQLHTPPDPPTIFTGQHQVEYSHFFKKKDTA